MGQQGGRVIFQNRAIQLGAMASESGPSGEHQVEQSAVSEHVAASVGRLSPNLFRRAVRRIQRVNLFGGLSTRAPREVSITE